MPDMPDSIENGETGALARKAAALTREMLTDAIRSALSELNEIGVRCGKRPVISTLSEDELLGYDEFGAPSR